MAFRIYRFGEFRLDPASRELWRGEEERKLQLKVFDCIAYLIENRDRAVGRDELIERIWGKGVHVSDGVLGKAISLARDGLGDTGEEQRFIKTIRGYGYRWVAPVHVDTCSPETGEPNGHIWRSRRWMAAAALTLASAAVAFYLWRLAVPDAMGGVGSRPEPGGIALLLPVNVESDSDEAWMRLGLMDHIAERLRAAGHAMVPSDSVVALLGNLPAEPRPEDLDHLITTSGAHLVLQARAVTRRTHWRVSLHSLRGAAPPLTSIGEAEDVLDAARIAADRMALSLGLPPPTGPRREPRLALLLQRAEAAMLAQQLDMARELIENADRDLRERPETRFQLGRILYYGGDFDAARDIFIALLREPGIERDPILHARTLHGIAATHIRRDEHEAAAPYLDDALRLLSAAHAPSALGRVYIGLNAVAMRRQQVDVATAHLAQSRMLLEATGDVQGMAYVENNRGVDEIVRERHREALSHLERAVELFRTLRDVNGELGALINAADVHLTLLAPREIETLQKRIGALVAQTTDPDLAARGRLAEVALLRVDGQMREADDLLAEVLQDLEATNDLPFARARALVPRIEQLMRGEQFQQAAELAGVATDHLLAESVHMVRERSRASLLRVRCQLAHGDISAATGSVAAMRQWTDRQDLSTHVYADSRKIYAALAEAELAAAQGRQALAAERFEHALAFADRSRAPLYLLEVAESYIPWLLGDGSDGISATAERAVLIADRLAAYAHHDYRAALLQLRVYHATGIPSAWRTAFDRARSLAGERRIPADLLNPPQPKLHETEDQEEVTFG